MKLINNKKKILSVSLILLLIIIALEIAIRAMLISREKFLFTNKDQLIFYKDKMNKLHHLRDVYDNNIKYKDDPTQFIFTKINYKEKNKKLILFQGDSRTQQLDNFLKIKDILDNNDFNLINGGSTSFSPSMMSVQYDILTEEYDLKPQIVIALIDPTDLGDEICRYKKHIVLNNDKILKINPTLNKKDFYFYENIFLMSEIKFFNGPKILKLHNLINNYIKYDLGKQAEQCKYKEIQNFLLEINQNEIEYFNNILGLYIKNISKDKFIKKIYIVLYPHIQHLDQNTFNIFYNIKLNKIINYKKLFEISDKIEILDFYDDNIFKDYKNNYNEIFIKDDPASHLTQKGINLFYAEIFKKMEINLND